MKVWISSVERKTSLSCECEFNFTDGRVSRASICTPSKLNPNNETRTNRCSPRESTNEKSIKLQRIQNILKFQITQNNFYTHRSIFALLRNKSHSRNEIIEYRTQIPEEKAVVAIRAVRSMATTVLTVLKQWVSTGSDMQHAHHNLSIPNDKN